MIVFCRACTNEFIVRRHCLYKHFPAILKSALEFATCGHYMSSSPVQVFANLADREGIDASGRDFNAVFVFTHQHAIAYPLYSQRNVHQPFCVSFLIIETPEFFFVEGYYCSPVAIEDFKFVVEGIDLKPKAVE